MSDDILYIRSSQGYILAEDSMFNGNLLYMYILIYIYISYGLLGPVCHQSLQVTGLGRSILGRFQGRPNLPVSDSLRVYDARHMRLIVILWVPS